MKVDDKSENLMRQFEASLRLFEDLRNFVEQVSRLDPDDTVGASRVWIEPHGGPTHLREAAESLSHRLVASGAVRPT